MKPTTTEVLNNSFIVPVLYAAHNKRTSINVGYDEFIVKPNAFGKINGNCIIKIWQNKTGRDSASISFFLHPVKTHAVKKIRDISKNQQKVR